MSEYHVIRADGSGTIASFDRWGDPVKTAWHAAAKTCAVNLICMWRCGCLYRAIVKDRTRPPIARFKKGRLVRGRRKTVRVHTGWRRVEVCTAHAHRKKLGTVPQPDGGGPNGYPEDWRGEATS